jgi:hypothetical protein
MPQFLLHDRDFMKYAVDEACKLEESMDETRSDAVNAQTRFKKYKDQIIEFAKVRASISAGATEKKKRKLQEESKALKNEPTTMDCGDGTPPNAPAQAENSTESVRIKSPEEIAELLANLQKRINELVDRQMGRKKLETRVRGYTELNRIT